MNNFLHSKLNLAFIRCAVENHGGGSSRQTVENGYGLRNSLEECPACSNSVLGRERERLLF